MSAMVDKGHTPYSNAGQIKQVDVWVNAIYMSKYEIGSLELYG